MVRGPERGERFMVPELESSSQQCLSGPRLEQKLYSLLQELVSRFSQQGDTVADLSAGTFSAVAACLTMPHHRVFVDCKADLECSL